MTRSARNIPRQEKSADPTPRSGKSAATLAEAYRLEDQVGFKLRKVQQKATEIFNDVMSDFDLTPMQFAVLAKLDDLGTVSQNQLGRTAAMDPATTFGVVGRLMKRGLISQSTDQADARLILISLSDKGQRLVTEMKAVGTLVSDRTLAPLSPSEAALFVALLSKLE